MLKQYTHRDLTLWVREDDPWDRAVIDEVQDHYFPSVIDYRRILAAFDIGAHIGAWTVFVKKYSPAAAVVAVEPDETNYFILQRNVATLPNVQALRGWIWDRRDGVQWVRNLSKTGSHALVTPNDPLPSWWEPGTRWEVTGVDGFILRLRDLVAAHDIGIVDVVKLDCEGCEKKVLDIETLAKMPVRFVVGEWHGTTAEFHLAAKRIESVFQLADFIDGPTLSRFCFENRTM